MRAQYLFILFSFLIPGASFAQAPAQKTAGSRIFLPEDELTLPPFLKDIGSEDEPESRLNVQGIDHHPHQAQKGEWLDFGDSLTLPARISFQILQKETIQWVGGGVFTGQIGAGKSVKDDAISEVKLTHGWMKAWVKPDALHSALRVVTQAGNFIASHAIFWVYSRPDRTEVYLIEGEMQVESSKKPFRNKGYATFSKGQKEPLYVSTDWAPKAIEVKIAGSYPQFIKLADEAEEQWNDGRAEKTYAAYRKKGWRKASRLDPHSK